MLKISQKKNWKNNRPKFSVFFYWVVYAYQFFNEKVHGVKLWKISPFEHLPPKLKPYVLPWDKGKKKLYVVIAFLHIFSQLVTKNFFLS